MGDKAAIAQLETEDDMTSGPILIPFTSGSIQPQQESASSIPGVLFNKWQTSPRQQHKLDIISILEWCNQVE